jgi:predicted RNase H-like nuclease (RuvC/YqgF family)
MSDLEERLKEAEARARAAETELVALKDDVEAVRKEVQAMMRMVVSLEVERDELRRQLGLKRPSTRPPPLPPPEEVEKNRQFDMAMKRIVDLRELLSEASKQLSELHAEEIALSARRARVLGDTCSILARAVGESGGTVPPPLPSTALDEKLAYRPVVDISEVADLIDSLRPPPPSR